MITGEIESKVDRIWGTMWSGGISNPLTVIEQLTYLLQIDPRFHELRGSLLELDGPGSADFEGRNG